MRRRLSVVACFALAPVVLIAQDMVFRSQTDVVTVDVSVRESGKPALGLTIADFELVDAGEAQILDAVTYESGAIETTLVVDMSGSIDGPLLGAIRGAVSDVQARLRSADRINLVRFNHRIAEAPVNAATNLTALLASPVGQTSMLDALVASLIRPNAGTARQLLILFTDGQDSLSFLDEQTVLSVAERSDAAVFGVAGSDAAIERLPHRGIFEALTKSTGGRFAALGRRGNLGAAFVQALDDFRQRYVLSYVVRREPKPGWHPVDVRVLRPGRFDVRARRGYFVASPAPRPAPE